MDQSEPVLDDMRRKAGAAYLSAVENLGLRPDALFWAFDKVEGRFVLMLATEMFDFKGPLAVAALLFKAYNAAATPKEIDPFIVRLHSPHHGLIQRLYGFRDLSKATITPKDGAPPMEDIKVDSVAFGDVQFKPEWVYRFTLPGRRDTGTLIRRWRKLEATVDKLAA